MPNIAQHVGGLAPCSWAAPLTLRVPVGAEAAHEALAIEVWGPLFQLGQLVLYHLLPIWAAGLEHCRHRVGWGEGPPQTRGGEANPTKPLAWPLPTELSAKLLKAPSLLQGGRGQWTTAVALAQEELSDLSSTGRAAPWHSTHSLPGHPSCPNLTPSDAPQLSSDDPSSWKPFLPTHPLAPNSGLGWVLLPWVLMTPSLALPTLLD